MFSRSARRLSTTILVMLSLLFSQLALANYACPPVVSANGESAAMEMAGGEPCQGMAMDAGKTMDPEQPVLCHQHCVQAPQSFDPVQAPAASLPAVVLVLVVPALLDAGSSESVLTADAAQARPPPDPLFLSTLRLRV